jgi:hypothetical protein
VPVLDVSAIPPPAKPVPMNRMRSVKGLEDRGGPYLLSSTLLYLWRLVLNHIEYTGWPAGPECQYMFYKSHVSKAS